jgi:hypothetical protein
LSIALIPIVILTGSPANGATIDLASYRLTISDEFNELNVSALGPGTKWIAHTPWGGDFGDAAFADPKPGFPFLVQSGVLRIEARKDESGRWQSGLLSSTDPSGRGFMQQFGYFEMRAKLPPGPGVWPAFWLIANQDTNTSAEIDVLEYYGHRPDIYHSASAVWPKPGKETAIEKRVYHVQHTVPHGSLYEEFHDYGVSVEPDWTVFYLDKLEMGRVATPPEHHRPMFVLLNLALGSVDHVRVYQRDR